MGKDLLIKLKVNTKKPPLMVEYGVDPTIAPYLVSSTRGFHWLSAPLMNNKVRVAIRKENIESLYSEVIKEIMQTGSDCNWGNIHAFNRKGIMEAVEYLKFFGIEDVEILSSFDNPLNLKKTYKKIPITYVDWLEKCCAIIPKDRGFFGSLTDFGKGYYAVLVHNPSRGIAFSA